MAKYEKDQVLKGKVTGIQPFGAFVALDDETQGLVHISEISHDYVKDVNEYVQVGQEVEVKILDVDEASKKIKLSMKATQEAPKREKSAKPARRGAPRRNEASNFKQEEAPGFTVLKDKLEDWIKNTNFKK
ncbi:general stress protein 13 [Exiguobacterium sp. SH3S2]|jgi:general stress protein 13|uniref:General stress protein n=3 Tax=Exiguobacterium TaxID=33986 RepID=U1N2Z6_9BACL|nr:MULTISPECIES: S1 domain-containing post-transcriptional regulator GSP13 [Exiguobacterium]EPE61545.1 general stress protein 13 [Exiguobacterium sp. S17]ERG68281.1 general stress protein [Exiguobacterium chiriqhucha RW-2]KAB2865618.1 MAG: general stress protein 13 [Exiguobacterium chiriqhucha]KGI85935.1 general stress protein [Exiguobacterium mexicanum]MCT4777618.1 S1 domain-containing post-transcriptional regulator GSP13 [Exiguobacterium aquaticum]